MTALRPRFRAWWIGLCSVLVTAGLGCASISLGTGSHDNNGTGDPANWSISASAPDLNPTIQQGAADTIAVTVTRAGGYTGAVSITPFVGAQGGITAVIDNLATTNNVTTARLIITIGANFPTGPGQGVTLALMPDRAVTPINLEFSINIVAKPGVFVTAPSTLSVGQGSATSATISLRRTNYTAAVPMSIVTTQAGITATFSPNPVTDTITQMTLSADASVPTGTYSVGVRANNGDVVYQATAPVTLTVTPPGSIVLTTNLPTLIVPKGGTVPTGVTIARTNYTGPVTLALTGLPAGMTATIATNPVNGTNGSISFTAAAGMASGSYPITITGTGVGIASASVQMSLSVP